MILRRLVEYADTRMDLPPAMYDSTPIRWLISLDPDGKLEDFVPLGGDTRANRRGERMAVPTLVRASKIKPKLLADNGEYVLGVGRPDSDAVKVADRHRRFLELTRRCARETGERSLQAVVAFLDEWDSGELHGRLREDFDPQDNLTFRVGTIFPAVDLRSVQAFWAKETGTGSGPVMACLVTGKIGPVEQRLPVKVKGLTRIGGQASGTSLISANAEPFESFGLKNSLTSPISRDAGERFGKALNQLLSDEKSRIFIGPTAYAFWTRQESDFDFANLMNQPDAERVKNLLASPLTGAELSDVGSNEFYALVLSASGGRAVVRDWLETTVPRAKENLKKWFRAQRIVNPYGEEAGPLGVYALAASAYRDANKEMTPQIPLFLVRAAIGGGRISEDLLARAVRRNRVDGDVDHRRAALVKLVLGYGREGVEMTDAMEKLDPDHAEPAYHCGRLLAQLEMLQIAAIPGVKATIVDRYYGAASSAPASVFGSLMRSSNAHLGKIRKERPGAGATIQDRIGEITTSIGGYFPNTLNMRQQAIFGLGYYHQRAQNRADARAAREAREASNRKEGS